MFEGYFADMCSEKIPLMLMGAERSVPCAWTRERGPPSASAEIEYSGSGDASEHAESGTEVSEKGVTNIKTNILTVNVRSTDENDKRHAIEEVNTDLEIMEKVKIHDEERDLFDRQTGIDRANHDIVFYCFLTIVILLPCILLSYIYVNKK